MRVKEIFDNERKRYDEFVASSPNGHIFQSYEWGEVFKKGGWHPIRLIVEDGNEIKAGISILKKNLLFGYSIFYAPRGPIVDYQDEEIFIFLLNEIKKRAFSHRAIFLQINPDIPQDNNFIKDCLKEKGFLNIEKYGLFRLTQPRYVFRLNLQRDLEEIFQGFSKSVRKNIRIAEKEGVSVESKNSIEGLEIFYKLLKRTSKRKNFLIRPYQYQYRIYQEMVTRGLVEIFLAKYKDEYVASRLIFIFGNKSWDMYAGSNDKYPEIRANHLLVWEVIKFVKEKGCIWFDFRGAGAWDVPEHLERGIYEFKRRFGPDLCGFIGDYYLIFSPFIYSLYEKGEIFLQEIMKVFLKIKNNIKKFFSEKEREKKYSNLVLEKYGKEEEIKEYSLSLWNLGLGYEEKFIEKHFTEKGKILDVGCGAGREAIPLAKKGFEVIGIDFQPKMIEEAKKNTEIFKVKVEFLVMDACKLDFPDNSFDYILMLGSLLSWIPYRKNRVQTLRNAKRVLKTGGKVIFSVPSKNCHFKYKLYFSVVDNWRRFLKLFGISYLEPGDRFVNKVSGNRKISEGKTFFHMCSMEETIKDMQESGLTLIECKSREEIIKEIETPHRREKDYFIYYVARK